jgi:hypothetical protein
MSRLAPVAVLAVLVAGCGGGGTQTAGGAAHGAVAGPGGAYKWFVDGGTSPPGIAAENRRPGTLAWRLSARAAARRGVEGYVSAQDVRPGQHERIYVSASRARSVSISIYRMGWYGGRGGRLVLASRPQPTTAQPACQHDTSTGLTQCAWHPTLDIVIPASLPSGVYIVRMSTDTGDERDCLFVVEAAHPGALIAQIPTSTYEAYNDWGGDSLYPGGRRVGVTGTSQGVEVSYDRPYSTLDGAGQYLIRDVAMTRFLERFGYPVSYTTDTSVDRDPGQLLGARVALDMGHSEYWSAVAERAFSDARDHGVNLVFLSSDTLAWRVRLRPAGAASSEAGAPDHVIVGYKEHASLDPGSPATGAFPDKGAGLTGSAYLGCITPRLPMSGRAVYRYYDWSPAAPPGPSWLFAGTGLAPGVAVHGILGYELDQRTPASAPGVRVIGGGRAPCMSGGTAGSSALGETTLYRARSGATVFASGTLGWEFGLSPVLAASPDAPRAPDPGLIRLTRNLFDHLLGGA